MTTKMKTILIASLLAAHLLIPAGTQAATLLWDANTDQVDGYRIHYGTDQQSLSQIVDVGNITSYDLNRMPLSEGVVYYFALSAYNSAGESPLTPVLTYQPADSTPPSPPTGFAAVIP